MILMEFKFLASVLDLAQLSCFRKYLQFLHLVCTHLPDDVQVHVLPALAGMQGVEDLHRNFHVSYFQVLFFFKGRVGGGGGCHCWTPGKIR